MPPERKRKSGQGAIAAGPAHGKAPKLEDYLKGNRPQHVKMLSEWMHAKAEEHGDMHHFLVDKLSSEGVIKDYLMFLEKAFPVPDDVQMFLTSSDMMRSGGVLLRPWHLNWMPDAGFKGYVDPDQLVLIAELICSVGFQTCSDQAGVEKLAITAPVGGMVKQRPPFTCQDLFPHFPNCKEVVGPMGCLFVKGWTRSVAATCVMVACWEVSELLEALPEETKRTFSVIHGAVQTVDTSLPAKDMLQVLVAQNRGVTLISCNTRRRPNAFNLLHQLKLIHPDSASFEKEYADLGSFQSALTIGKSEAAAAWNLVKEIEYPITETLCRLVQVHSQPKFIYHEPLAGGLFNREYNSGQGQYTAWQEALQNNLEVVKLMVQRMQAEFESTPVKFRKPWSLKDVEALQRHCGVFIAALSAAQSKVPEDFLQKEMAGLMKSFNTKHLDVELQSLLEGTAPPVQLEKVSVFRSLLFKYKRQVDEAAEKVALELEAEMQTLTLKQHVEKVDSELRTMTAWSQSKSEFDKRSSKLDIKYCQDRYAKGVVAVDRFMATKHKYIVTDDMAGGQVEIIRMAENLSSSRRQLLMILDVSTWPGRATYVEDALDIAKGICAGNSDACLLVFCPVLHRNVTLQAILRKRRAIEDKVSGNFDAIEWSVTYNDSGHANDKRKKNQNGWIATSQLASGSCWGKSKACLGTLGNVDRAKLTDLQNFQPDAPLSHATKAQQKGVQACRQILQNVLDGAITGGGETPEKLLIVDLCNNRYNEWGQAVWQEQLECLNSGSGKRVDFHFLGFINAGEDDSRDPVADRLPASMSGKMIAEWWDKSAEAGATSRPRQVFPETRPSLSTLAWKDGKLQLPAVIADSFSTSSDPAAKHTYEQLKSRVVQWNHKWGETVASVTAQGPQAVSATQPDPARLACKPEFGETEQPLDVSRMYDVPSDCVAEPDQLATELKAAGFAMSNAKVKVVLKNDWSLWLVNGTSEDISLEASELFGFGLATFAEKLAGLARLNPEWIPWHLVLDSDLVCLVSESGAKKLVPLAEVVYSAGQQGIMEVGVTDYSLEPKCKEDGTSLNFRYILESKPKINVMVVKALDAKQDTTNVRGSLLGCAFAGNLDKLPRSSQCRVVWEVSLQTSHPAVIIPRKAKVWTTCQLVLRANKAHRLS